MRPIIVYKCTDTKCKNERCVLTLQDVRNFGGKPVKLYVGCLRTNLDRSASGQGWEIIHE